MSQPTNQISKGNPDFDRFRELIVLAYTPGLTKEQIDQALKELHEMKARNFTQKAA